MYFEKNKPSGLILSKMMMTSFEDHIRYFYKTDHHWNIRGALQAYDGIYDLLAQNYPGISLPVKIDSLYTFPDIGYLGSLARLTLYPIRPEKFEVALYELPQYKILENGQEIIFNHSAEYLAGNYSNEPYIDHYAEYFGYLTPSLEYVFENGSNRNLLIFGDSYDTPLQPIIASHYFHTYIIDPLYVDNFSLSEFLSQHHVDDILFLGDCAVVCINNDWLINP